jgi:predicted branched-subunit amino acid permease
MVAYFLLGVASGLFLYPSITYPALIGLGVIIVAMLVMLAASALPR